MNVHLEIAAETLFEVGPIPVTNSMLTMFIVMVLLIGAGRIIAKRATDVPGRAQSIFEMIAEFLIGLVESTGGKRQGRRVFPLVGGIFIFIIFANYTGLLPGVGTIGYWEEEAAEHTTEETDQTETNTTEETHQEEDASSIRVFEVAATGSASQSLSTSAQEASDDEEEHKVLVPFLRPPNADLNMTLAMALVTFTVVQVLGIRAHGVRGRIKHMANPPFLFPIEVVSEFSRIISLSARLFGNVFAGEALLAVMNAMAVATKIVVLPVLFPVVFLFLEVLFGAVQALVFALLTMIYISLATEGGHEEHEDEHEYEHGAAPATISHAPAD